MQREHIRRGFSIYVHQKVVLEIDFSGSLWGYTEITLIPETKDLRTIFLHSRQCTIHSVTVASYPAEFSHYDPLANIHLSKPDDCHAHPELKRKVYSALAEGDEGELSIAIPKDVVIRQSGHAAAGIMSEAATPEPQTPGFNVPSAVPAFEFSPITVNVSYSLRNPADGIQFVQPTDAYPYRVPHVYTTSSSPDAARCWVPCLDNFWERCTWEFEFVVPRHLSELEDGVSVGADDEDRDDEYPTVVVCSGELVEQVSHPHNSGKTIFMFSQSTPASVQHVSWTAGPFHMLRIPADLSTAEDVSGSSQPLMYAFCLPGREEQLLETASFMRSAMSFYSSEFGSYPFGSHTLAFVDEMPTQRFDSATLSLVTSDLLHGKGAIDQVLETRLSLSHALACQWVGINIHQKTWSDTWLVNGLGLYITGLFMRRLFGNNEYRFRLKKDMERVIEMDNGTMPPICQPQVLDPPDSNTLSFVNLKAPLVLHILDRRLGKSGTSLGLSRVLPKVFLSALSGELPNNAISTHAFLRTCRKVSGIDPRSFAEQWIYGSGCPTFTFGASFNRKKMAVEISMKQETPAFKTHEDNEVMKLLFKPVPLFEGQMTIRIHEADGTPYEHVLDIRNAFKRYEVPFNTKYKRVRRNTKRYLARQAAAQAAAEGDAEAAAAMDMVDMGFGLEIWEKEKERDNWKVADWTEEDEQQMAGQTYEWIRIDADFEWIAAINFEQKDYMWVSQLQRDRDVVAQYEAITVLTRSPTPIISSTFTKTVLVSNYYFRIRCEAAQALVTCAIQRMDWLGLFHLFKLFLRYCYDPEDPDQDLFTHTYVPRPNEFSDFAEYFVRKSLIKAISRVRFETGKTPPVVRQFLVDQLRYNDNTMNAYSDGLYICTLISSLASATVSAKPPEVGEFVATEPRPTMDSQDVDLLEQAKVENDRYQKMDGLIPSAHNVVTIATIEFNLILGVANLVPLDPAQYISFTREGNYTQLRMAAFDALFLTKWYIPPIVAYILAVMANDPSRVIRRQVARNVCQSLALLVTMGLMKESVKKSKSAVLVEEDGASQEGEKDSKKNDIDFRSFRKNELGKNEMLRQSLLPIIMAPDADYEVRWSLLKFADLLIRGAPETAPSITIHLPPTPVTELPPPLPAIKPALKLHRTMSLKAATTPAKSPLTPFMVPPKLKLPVNGPRTDVIPRTPVPTASEVKRINSRPFPVPSIPASVKVTVKPQSKNVPKARSSGMSPKDVLACQSALKKLRGNKHATIFLQAVDPIRDGLADYLDVIKNPMDLNTMSEKLKRGQYRDRFNFEQDFRLMIANAKQYNMPKSYGYEEALALESFFNTQWGRINKTLEAQAAQETAKSNQQSPHRVIANVKISPAQPKVPLATPTPGPSVSTSTRPIIKLRVGGPKANGTPTSTPVSEAPKAASKGKARSESKVSIPDQTTDSYFDDGSADRDLLEEVIAIEREKDQERKQAAPDKGREREREKEKDREKEREKEKDREKEREREQHEQEVEREKKEKERKRDMKEKEKREKEKKERREKEKERDRDEKEQEKQVIPKLVIGKRKKMPAVDQTADEDELLALATPAKKERSVAASPAPVAGPSTSGRSSDKGSAKASPAPTPLPPTKNGTKIEKVTKAKGSAAATAATPKISIKGKEKETISQAASQTKKSSSPHEDATPLNEKKCKEMLRTLTKIPDASIFLQPVDPVRDGCPTYYDEIKNPMDFGTMSSKLSQSEYRTMEEFARDVGLIFSNCRTFNPPTTYPVQCADAVERVWKTTWSKVLEKKLSWNEKRSLQSIMNKLVQDPLSFVFRVPVDPVVLGIPQYFQIIPRRNARDLRTIRQKLDADKYSSVEAFEADLDLMILNARVFNGEDSEIGKVALDLQEKYKDMLSSVRTGVSVKRKGGDKGTPQPTKKARLG